MTTPNKRSPLMNHGRVSALMIMRVRIAEVDIGAVDVVLC
jgi:hypothetical protein